MAIRSIAAAILTGEAGELFLQQRDNIPGILFPGRIGLFGGHVEEGESFLQAVCREIREETSLDLPPDEFKPLADYQTRYPDGSGVNGAFYLVQGVHVDPKQISEGQLKVVPLHEVEACYGQMTPATSFVIKTYLEEGSWKD